MLRIVFYFIWFSNILLMVTKNKSRIISILSFILSFVLFAGNNMNPDYMVYQWGYNQHTFEGFEFGFKFLSLQAQHLSLDYQGMLMLVQLVSLVLIWICIRVITSNINAFWAMYFFSQQFIDIIQWRNYFASVFLLCAVTLLYKNKKFFSLIFVAIACSFHITFFVFVPFVLLYNKKAKLKIKNIYIIAFVIITTYIIGYTINLISNIDILQNSVQVLGMNNRYQYYGIGTRFGSILPFAIYLIDLYLILWISRSEYFLSNNLANIIVKLNVFVGIFTPLLLIDINFYRIFRDINIINFVFIAYILDKNTVVDKLYIKQLCVVFVMCTLWKLMTLEQGTIIFSSIYNNNLWIK